MTDLERETRVSIGDLALIFGVAPFTVKAWLSAGLESERNRGGVFTTSEALQRFAEDDSPDFITEREDVSRRLVALSGR